MRTTIFRFLIKLELVSTMPEVCVLLNTRRHNTPEATLFYTYCRIFFSNLQSSPPWDALTFFHDSLRVTFHERIM